MIFHTTDGDILLKYIALMETMKSNYITGNLLEMKERKKANEAKFIFFHLKCTLETVTFCVNASMFAS